MNNIYFDNAATTRIDDKVLKKMMPYLKENYGNASAIYKLGKESHKAIEEVRNFIAETFNCNKDEIYFTSGGSESDNTALKGIAYANKDKGSGDNKRKWDGNPDNDNQGQQQSRRLETVKAYAAGY